MSLRFVFRVNCFHIIIYILNLFLIKKGKHRPF